MRIQYGAIAEILPKFCRNFAEILPMAICQGNIYRRSFRPLMRSRWLLGKRSRMLVVNTGVKCLNPKNSILNFSETKKSASFTGCSPWEIRLSPDLAGRFPPSQAKSRADGQFMMINFAAKF